MTHRFINADGLVSTGTGILGHNMFAYCDNNPVNCKDVTGNKTIRDIQMDIANGDATYNIMDVTRMQMAGYAGTTDSGKDVYIAPNSSHFIPSGDNVFVNDFRTYANPDIQVVGSYLITEYRDMEEIATILVEYNTYNPIDGEVVWDLDVDDIVSEWMAHNFLNTFAPHGVDNFESADFDVDQDARRVMNALF